MLELSEDDWDKTIDINLKGYHLCCQAVGKGMVERKKGKIINIASVVAMVANKGLGVYAISKAGVVMLTKLLAVELASYNIRVNAIVPGSVRVERNRSWWSDPEHSKQGKASIPLGRAAEPSDIGSVALFLASDASSYITGATIVVDGGLLA